MAYLRALWGAREIIEHLVRRELRVRYKASVLGFFWSFLRPLLIMLILTVVFSFLLRFPIDYEIPCRLGAGWTGGSYPIFLLVALIPWFFTVGALNDSVGALVHNAPLIRKVALPGEVFPLASVLANLVNFFLSLAILLPVLFVLFEIRLHGYLLLLPLLVAVQLLMTVGIAFILSVGNVFFRDVTLIFELVSMMWFYLTPIFYPLSMIQERLPEREGLIISIFMLNPMTPLVQAYRWVLLRGAPVGAPERVVSLSAGQMALGAASVVFWTGVALALGVWLFRRFWRRIPDEL
ncbi:MAG TPA: ABC transporter permease [Firmicutes bacterium]|nr:ABC transporter permease [Bacillota bacterium]